MTIETETVVTKEETRRTGIVCDYCGKNYKPRAIGLVTWLTVSDGARRGDGGGHMADVDFCSQTCLANYVGCHKFDTNFPYKWVDTRA